MAKGESHELQVGSLRPPPKIQASRRSRIKTFGGGSCVQGSSRSRVEQVLDRREKPRNVCTGVRSRNHPALKPFVEAKGESHEMQVGSLHRYTINDAQPGIKKHL